MSEKRSESITNLAKSLVAVQKVLEIAKKDKENEYYSSSYADLTSVWDACRKPLTDNGLCIIQTGKFLPEHPNMVCIETTLLHTSGEFITSELVATPVKQNPQGVGSSITYLRRYGLQAIVGICPDDDDGNEASGQEKSKAKPKPEPVAKDPAKSTKKYKDALHALQTAILRYTDNDNGKAAACLMELAKKRGFNKVKKTSDLIFLEIEILQEDVEKLLNEQSSERA